ncbi:MAG: poly(A) polymerase [Planctomycetota bacterium]|nr:MAG: poly(A) polymerase [Planctomycetota bacterium]
MTVTTLSREQNTPGSGYQAPPPDLATSEALVFDRTAIPEHLLDDDAVKVVQRLERKGHEAYLVGGCVRDLLLNRRPKDFDVATSARPRQVKSAFRNCRIIGRRFKLAHLHFEDKILEVSTFRRTPQELGDSNGENEDNDLLITSDNEFGTAAEDAWRRDFTINALFYDPSRDQILDFVGGMADIERGLLRTIGDPLVRIKEDPVRILRAIKFASRLSLRIEARTWDAMCSEAGDLARSAPPRLLEELLRLLRSPHTVRSFQMLRACGALDVLLPELGDFLEDADREERENFWSMLAATDGLAKQRREAGFEKTPTAILLGALMLPLLERAKREADGRDSKLSEEERRSSRSRGREADYGRLAESVIGPVLRRMNLSRFESGRLKRICVVQRRFHRSGGSRPFKPQAFVRQDYFADALSLLRLRCLATDDHWDIYDDWSQRWREELAQHPEDAPEGVQTRAKNSRRNRPKAKERKPSQSRSQRPAHDRNDRHEGPRKKSKRRREDERPRRRRRKKRSEYREPEEPLQPLPPLPDVELDPSVVPTFGSVLGDTGSEEKVQLESSKGKRTRKKLEKADEPYVPPSVDELKEPQKQGPEDDDVFGDW